MGGESASTEKARKQRVFPVCPEMVRKVRLGIPAVIELLRDLVGMGDGFFGIDSQQKEKHRATRGVFDIRFGRFVCNRVANRSR